MTRKQNWSDIYDYLLQSVFHFILLHISSDKTHDIIVCTNVFGKFYIKYLKTVPYILWHIITCINFIMLYSYRLTI